MPGTSAEWPLALSESVVLTARVCQASGVEFGLQLRQAGGDHYVWDVANLIDGSWTTREGTEPFASALEAIRAHPTLKVGRGQTVDIEVEPGLVADVVRTIVPPKVVAESRDEWPDDVVERWTEYEDYLPLEAPTIEVWAEINGATLLVYVPEGQTHPYGVLYDWDEGQFLGLDVLAESTWFSESGGAPISWDGGSRISRLYPGMLLTQTWGDLNVGCERVAAVGPIEVGCAVADFIVGSDQQFMAAWHLEGLNSSALPKGDAARWTELVDGLELSLEIDLEPFEELVACRQRLHQDPAYARVAAALSDPSSDAGRELLGRLESVAESGVIGEIMGYNL